MSVYSKEKFFTIYFVTLLMFACGCACFKMSLYARSFGCSNNRGYFYIWLHTRYLITPYNRNRKKSTTEPVTWLRIIVRTYDGRKPKAGQDRVTAWPLPMHPSRPYAHANRLMLRSLDDGCSSNVRLSTEGTGSPEPRPWLLVVVDGHFACCASCHTLFTTRGPRVVDFMGCPVHGNLPVMAGALG